MGFFLMWIDMNYFFFKDYLLFGLFFVKICVLCFFSVLFMVNFLNKFIMMRIFVVIIFLLSIVLIILVIIFCFVLIIIVGIVKLLLFVLVIW